MRDSPIAILFDTSGHRIGSVPDDGIYRLTVESKNKSAVDATRTNVLSSVTDVLLLASNTNRISVFIHNASDSPLYIGFGSTPVTNSDYTLLMGAHAALELPDFAGEIHGVWEIESGSALVTEMT